MQAVQQFNPEEQINAVDAYGIDLTQSAREGNIDPVIGREDEIRRIVQILSRRTKNNPVLIGEPGTGKTTVVEGLARRIVENDVPENLKNKRLITLDLSALIAGAMYRGQFEERLKKFVKEVVESDGEIIVFIDELHTIVGAGAAEGQMDVSNMIKPELARSKMKVIGATTLKEYQKYIEKDAALERRFQHVMIHEPNIEDTITILRGIKDKYELHHGLQIRDNALISAAVLSDRYISDRFLPDKAVDLMDEAAAKLRMQINSSPIAIDDEKRNLMQLQIERESLKKEKDKSSKKRLKDINSQIKSCESNLKNLEHKWLQEKDKVSAFHKIKENIERLTLESEKAQRNGDFQKTARIQYNDIPNLEKDLENHAEEIQNNEFIKLEVDSDDIAEIVSKWTGIPLQKVMEGEKEKLLTLESELKNRVLGQDHVLEKVANVIRMSKTGITPPERPLGSFLFMGTTGVGKTELAKSLAEVLFDNEKVLVRLDMSEFMEAHSAAKLIGAPPGYVGYEEGGQLTERIRRQPYSVILFDEIEKAHPSVCNILLQILDDGLLTDTKGRTVNFKNTILILTSNLRESELTKTFRPEFINRIDDIVNFSSLNNQVVRNIVDLQLDRLNERLSENGFTISFDKKLPDYIAEHGYSLEFGARPVKRLIKNEIMAKISTQILNIPEEKNLKISLSDGGIEVSGNQKILK